MGKLDPYEALANAIVETAAKDYLAAYKKYLRRPAAGPNSEMKDLENFFHSQWYETLSSVDGNWLIAKLQEKAEQEISGKEKR